MSYELLLFLADRSYDELNSGDCGAGDRPSDERDEKLLLKIARVRKMRGQVCDVASTIKKLKMTAKNLALNHGVGGVWSRWKVGFRAVHECFPSESCSSRHSPAILLQ